MGKACIYAYAVLRLILLIAAASVDIVHIHFASRGSTLRKLILSLLVLCSGKPFILHAHGGGFPQFFNEMPRFIQKIIAHIFGKCSRLVVLSESWKQFYITSLKIHPEKVIVLSNPVHIPSQVPDRTVHQTVTLLFLGRLNQQKGVFDLIHAYAALPRHIRNKTRLVMAGDGENTVMRNRIRELGIETQVFVHDWLTPQLRDEALASADVFILPSYHEGLPMALLEAMAWELAVITTPVGGIPEIITHQKEGVYIQPGDVAALTETMQQLIEDGAYRLALGCAAKNRVGPLDIHVYVSMLRTLYQTIIKVE